jgi:hypothetical protein
MDAQKLVEVGGKRWQKGDMDRIYFDGLATWYGLVCKRYSSGNISGATLNGSSISNTYAREIENDLDALKVWYDVAADKFAGKGPYINENDYYRTIVKRIRSAVEAL